MKKSAFIAIRHSPFANYGNTGSFNTTDENQTALITRLIEAQIAMTEKIMALLEKK